LEISIAFYRIQKAVLPIEKEILSFLEFCGDLQAFSIKIIIDTYKK
jgi:hypothetical protein